MGSNFLVARLGSEFGSSDLHRALEVGAGLPKGESM